MNLNTDIKKAVEALRSGKVIIYPTDTVYGLGADIFNQDAVNRIYEIKGRKFVKSLSICIKKTWISEYAKIPEKAQVYLESLPGPYTLVLPKTEKVPSWISSNPYIGIRVPDCETVSKLLDDLGKPITSTSANLAGEIDPISVFDIDDSILDQVDLVLNIGETRYKGASRVIQINEKIKVLREGHIKSSIER